MKEYIISKLYQIGIEVDFDNIHSYCKFTENSLEQAQSKFKETYNTKLNELTAEEKEEFDQLAIDVQWKLHGVFPIFQWNSIFNSAYNMFEKHLNDLCKILGEQTTNQVGLKDLKGKGIERAKLFLSKVIGITDVFNSTEWSEIQSYSKIRNILVHTSGELDLNQNKHKEVYNYAMNHSKLVVHPEDPEADRGQLTILPEFIYDSLSSYKILLVKICRNSLIKDLY